MSKNKIVSLKKPEDFTADQLTELLRHRARQLIVDAVESELYGLLGHYADSKDQHGCQQVTRNSYLQEREIQTRIGLIKVKAHKMRDKSGQGIKFNSALLPPYPRKIKSVE